MNNQQKGIWIDRLFDIKQLLNAIYKKGHFVKHTDFKKYIDVITEIEEFINELKCQEKKEI
tara:strand:- start:379 stop:561 length:183 start_codon:yes stop_codon:yes gene_type:complete